MANIQPSSSSKDFLDRTILKLGVDPMGLVEFIVGVHFAGLRVKVAKIL